MAASTAGLEKSISPMEPSDFYKLCLTKASLTKDYLDFLKFGEFISLI